MAPYHLYVEWFNECHMRMGLPAPMKCSRPLLKTRFVKNGGGGGGGLFVRAYRACYPVCVRITMVWMISRYYSL